MIDGRLKFGIAIEKLWDGEWSFGICLSHSIDGQTYIFINLFKWTISIGKIINHEVYDEII